MYAIRSYYGIGAATVVRNVLRRFIGNLRTVIIDDQCGLDGFGTGDINLSAVKLEVHQ